MKRQAARFAGMARRVAAEEVQERGTGRYTAEIRRWDGPGSFTVDVVGLDFELTEDFVTVSQAVRAYDLSPGLEAGDNLILVELDEGEFTAIGVESGVALPEPVDVAALEAAIAALDVRLDALEAGPEAVRLVGDTGQPAFEGLWVNFDNGAASPSATPSHRNAGFYRHGGRVFLEGVVSAGSGTIFTLPAGYRPPVQRGRTLIGGGLTTAYITVGGDGVVALQGGSSTFLFLDGIDFRHA